MQSHLVSADYCHTLLLVVMSVVLGVELLLALMSAVVQVLKEEVVLVVPVPVPVLVTVYLPHLSLVVVFVMVILV